MKVLRLVSWYPYSEEDHNAPLADLFSKMMSREGAENTVLSVQIDPVVGLEKCSNAFFRLREYPRADYRLFRYHGWCLPRRNIQTLKWWRNSAKRAAEECWERAGPFDLIHAHTYWSAYIAAELKVQYGVPFIFTEHTAIHLKGLLQPIHRRLLPKLGRQSDKIHCASKAMCDHMEKIFNVSVEHIPLPVETNFFSEEVQFRSPLVKTKEPIVFLSVGAPWGTKGFDLLIEAFEKVRKSLAVNCQLQIGDQIPGQKKLERMAQKLGLSEDVVWLGPLRKHQLRKAMQKADVYVSASRYETFNRTILEAMSTGLPVVSTATYGPREYLREEVGKLVAVGNVDAIAKGMIDLVEEIGKYEPGRISEYVENHFSPRVLGPRYLQLYKEVI